MNYNHWLISMRMRTQKIKSSWNKFKMKIKFYFKKYNNKNLNLNKHVFNNKKLLKINKKTLKVQMIKLIN